MNNSTCEIIKISTPATIANICCGFDILGLALNTPQDQIIIKKNNSSKIQIQEIHNIKNISYDPKKNIAGITLNYFLKKYNEKKLGFEIKMYKNILPGSGLGSSAASAAGAVMGANLLLNSPFTLKEIIKIAMKGEQASSLNTNKHADNVIPAIIGGVTLIRDYTTLDIIKLHYPKKLWITILHPQLEFKTSELRKIIPDKISLKNIVQQTGNLGGLISGFYKEDYDLIQRSLKDVIAEPTRSDLIPNYNTLMKECKNSGYSIGGGISGSGPSIFIFSKNKNNAQKIQKIMHKSYSSLKIKYNIYISKINKQGSYIIDNN
jgi:homoserine kinase